ncbi:pigment biosynthesis-related tyrosinase [Sorangium cellulosum]|uniref:Pigment biosynthesis-related tyrosinase n=1 Tax=Sorangium cellulosum TaxID=56 RepID=A0A2L0F4A2_SORCE|nr:tyrosinase family protein [Sorangium cellulosum]AUX46382.1 pigment biosynthesis-related tyrosinase [Sorangium cellulosum]
MTTVGTRRSVQDLQAAYDRGDKKPLEDVMRAWRGIKSLSPRDQNSFFVIGGYHGEPFEVRKAVDALSPTDIYAYWGGWCNHGNILFPTWHRAYLHRLEQALQTIVPGVMLPFWDETSPESLAGGIPRALTAEKFELDGELIDNPLRSFTLPHDLTDDYWLDNTGGETTPYFKPKGYETVRYPLSGLVGNATDRLATWQHNAQYLNHAACTEKLDSNIKAWLSGSGPDGAGPTPSDPDPSGFGIYTMFEKCLEAPNYTVFSNTTSAAAWNHGASGATELVVPLEQPHNDIHLAVGGFDLPGQTLDSGQVTGSNADMGENNTAALDPIFYFHHCNIDRMFWLWQKRHNQTEKLEGPINLGTGGYPGTSSTDNQGPTPGIPPGTQLDYTTPLRPFTNPKTNAPFTSEDVVNIEKLGYTYGPGSLEEPTKRVPAAVKAGGSKKILTVSGIDRARFQGSFVLSAFATITGANGQTTTRPLGHHSVLSRWSVIKCANCRTHLNVIAHFPLSTLTDEEVENATFSVKITQRGTPATGVKIVTSVN